MTIKNFSNAVTTCKRARILSIIMLGYLLAGCSWLQRKHQPDYLNSGQTHPLQVPSQLDTPNNSAALVIPEVTGAAPSNAPEIEAATSIESVPIMSAVTLGGDGLRVADAIDSVWTRTERALESSDKAVILTRDKANHRFDIKISTETTVASGGWFKRMLSFGKSKKKVVEVLLTVHINGDAATSNVTIEGSVEAASEQAAREVLELLRLQLS